MHRFVTDSTLMHLNLQRGDTPIHAVVRAATGLISES